MATNEASMTAAEVRILAERIQARATSQFVVGPASQQSDGILAAAVITHLIVELQELRSKVALAAESCSDEVTARTLRDALTERDPHQRGVIRVRFE
jgi:hypothetical protein